MFLKIECIECKKYKDNECSLFLVPPPDSYKKCNYFDSSVNKTTYTSKEEKLVD
jgi:hypothetical protein